MSVTSKINKTASDLPPRSRQKTNSIEKQDAIVLNELKEIPQALQTTLKSFAEKGGNIIFIPSEEASVSNMNAFLSTISSILYKTKNSNEKLVTKIND